MKKLSRQTAIAKSLGRYFNGKPCVRGHVSERYVKSGSCVRCHLTTFVKRHWKKHDRLEYQKDYYRRISSEKPEQIMFHSAKTRARKFGVPFSLTMEDIKAAWPKDGRCPALGVPIRHSTKPNGGMAANSPSLDRIVPAKGYVPGNVAIISVRANRIKNNETDPKAIRQVATWLERSLRSA